MAVRKRFELHFQWWRSLYLRIFCRAYWCRMQALLTLLNEIDERHKGQEDDTHGR